MKKFIVMFLLRKYFKRKQSIVPITTVRSCTRMLRHGVIALLILSVSMSVWAGGANWKRYERKSDDWYKSKECRQVVANVLSWQTAYGSWPKNLDTTAKPCPPKERKKLKGTYDNSATMGETRFLARVYNITGDRKCRDAVLKSIDAILDAQYPTGGWPQYPPPNNKGYYKYITFNDGAMVNVMYFMKDVAESDVFAFAGKERRQKAAAAFDKGIECILNCQIVVDGKLTAWCAQHDEVTLEPRKARSYELPSISGAESAGIVRLLMKYGDASDPRIVKSINSACEWFEKVKLLGIRQIVKNGDKKIIDDPTAPPLWARFYEIGTNRPFFCGRDGIVKYDISQIESERRNGYSWYVDSPQDALSEWKKWKKKHGISR